MHAEQAYLFKHALVRDASYQVQLPGKRSGLHEHALEILDETCAGPQLVELAVHARAVADNSAGDKKRQFMQRELTYLIKAAEFAEQEYDNSASIRLNQQCADHELIESNDLCKALLGAGHGLMMIGQNSEAEVKFQEALVVSTSGDETLSLQADVLKSLGLVAQHTSRIDLARRHFQASLEIYEKLGVQSQVANSLLNLASISPRTDPQARELCESALKIHRSLGERGAEGIDLGILAVTHLADGNFGGAEELYRESISIHVEVGNTRYLGISQANLASLLIQLGRNDESRELCMQALENLRIVGDRRSQGHVLGQIPMLDKRAEKYADAEAGYYRAITLLREVGERHLESFAIGNLALLLQRAGKLRAVEDLFALCLDGMELAGDHLNQAVFGCLLGRHRLLLGDEAMAQKLADAAESIVEHGPLKIDYPMNLALRLAVFRGERSKALEILDEMNQMGQELALKADSDTQKSIALCQELIQSRDIYNGHLHSELTPQLRLSLAARTRGDTGSVDVPLYGTSGLQEPDWESAFSFPDSTEES
ncbi:MAG: tetratricopeptide repeat protein [Planctomycetota bacterium]|jgi:tetratricopeptide (TPR) repeat protein